MKACYKPVALGRISISIFAGGHPARNVVPVGKPAMPEGNGRKSQRPRRLKTSTRVQLALILRKWQDRRVLSRADIDLLVQGAGRWLEGGNPWPERAGAPPVLNRWERRIEVVSVWLLRSMDVSRAEVAEALGIRKHSTRATAGYITEATTQGERIAAGSRWPASKPKAAKRGPDTGNAPDPMEWLNEGKADDGTFDLVMAAIDHTRSSKLPEATAPKLRAHLEALRAKWTASREERRRRDAEGEFVE